jgi:tRNA threonylcarbamoyladenosine biosynthesis protein TsaE
VASITSHSPAETFDAGRAFAGSLRPGDIVGLCGELGAGKTHFVKGIAAGLGSAAAVLSPTFTLVHEYRDGRMPIFHIDFYRLETPGEAAQIGLDECLDAGGVTVIEWAEKFPELLPPETRWVTIRAGMTVSERELNLP